MDFDPDQTKTHTTSRRQEFRSGEPPQTRGLDLIQSSPRQERTFAEETISLPSSLGHAQGESLRQVSAVRRGIMQPFTLHITRQAR